MMDKTRNSKTDWQAY